MTRRSTGACLLRFARPTCLAALGMFGGGCSDIANGDFSADTFTGSASAGSTATAGTDGDSGPTSEGTTGEGDSAGTSGDSGGEPPDDGKPGSPDDGETTGGLACDDQTPVELWISPDDSNSMSSPVQARDAILDGWNYLSAIAIRTHEFFNYYSFSYPAPEPTELAVFASMWEGAKATPGEWVLQIAVRSEDLTMANRPPVTLTFVLDTSGSMKGEPLERLKDTCRAIASSLKAGDLVSMVTWNTDQVPKLAGYEVSGPDDSTLLAEIEAITASGGTDLNAGLQAGYDLANRFFAVDRVNRLVLVSDGGANVGVTEASLIAENATKNSGDGIYLVGVGVGQADTYDDALMDHVTDAGKGASVFVTSSDEARKIFDERFISTMMIAARNVRVNLGLPPGFELVELSAEKWSGDPSDIEPQHLAPNDTMVLHQRVQTCAPHILDGNSQLTVRLQWEDASTHLDRELVRTFSFAELLGNADPLMFKGAAVFAYAQALDAYKQAATADEKSSIVGEALTILELAEAKLAQDAELAEIREVLQLLQ